MQTRRRSLLESITYTIFGLAYAVPLNWVMLTKIHWPDYWIQAITMTVVFTVIGIAYKYVTRRFFNWLDIAYPVS